ncbi:MAG: carboxylesterase family protein [Corynebacterium sp.]|nr:carboxylesterase family protein [Corynebacterium sp.]
MGEIIVTAPSGQFNGMTVADTDGKVTRFPRITYASAPSFGAAEPVQSGVETHPQHLVLSVTAPSDAKPLDDLPVVVFIHGGSYEFGAYDEPWFNAVPLAQAGVITVSVEYRLGFSGFIQFADDEPDRYRGVDDCDVALEWVQQNIESFGGSPANVTLVGQSAGAGIVLWLCRRDHYKGAFRRAWAMSPAYPRQKFHTELARTLLQSRLTREKLASMPADRLAKVESRMRSMVFSDLRFGPQPFRAQELAEIPLVVTCTQEEMLLVPNAKKLDASWIGKVLMPMNLKLFGANSNWVPPHRVRQLGYLIGDASIRSFVVKVADARPDKTWVLEYRGTVKKPIYHCADIPWFFGNYELLPAGIPESLDCPPLAVLVQAEALRFIAGEDPSWPVYGADKQVLVAHLDGSTAVVTDPLAYIREGIK